MADSDVLLQEINKDAMSKFYEEECQNPSAKRSK